MLLFACHFTNATAQSVQVRIRVFFRYILNSEPYVKYARYLNYWHNGGREAKYGMGPVKKAVDDVKASASDTTHTAKTEVKSIV